MIKKYFLLLSLTLVILLSTPALSQPTYDNLLSNPDLYIGERIELEGLVLLTFPHDNFQEVMLSENAGKVDPKYIESYNLFVFDDIFGRKLKDMDRIKVSVKFDGLRQFPGGLEPRGEIVSGTILN